MKNSKSNNGGHKMAMGLGVTALAAAAAGAYYLYGSTKGPARRKVLKGWMLKMKGEIMDEVENLKELTEQGYYDVIDKASKKYEGMKNIDQKELMTTIKRLKGHWKDIKKQLKA